MLQPWRTSWQQPSPLVATRATTRRPWCATPAARSLDHFAERGRPLAQLGPNVRELIVQSYWLIYEVREDAVEIVAFVHGARDLAAWWEREQR